MLNGCLVERIAGFGNNEPNVVGVYARGATIVLDTIGKRLY